MYLGQTTNEYQNQVFQSHPNPFDKGLAGNCDEICCTPVPASQIGDLGKYCSAQDYLNVNVDRVQLEELLARSAYHAPSFYNAVEDMSVSQKVRTFSRDGSGSYQYGSFVHDPCRFDMTFSMKSTEMPAPTQFSERSDTQDSGREEGMQQGLADVEQQLAT